VLPQVVQWALLQVVRSVLPLAAPQVPLPLMHSARRTRARKDGLRNDHRYPNRLTSQA
jgi:hypothetical protein